MAEIQARLWRPLNDMSGNNHRSTPDGVSISSSKGTFQRGKPLGGSRSRFFARDCGVLANSLVRYDGR